MAAKQRWDADSRAAHAVSQRLEGAAFKQIGLELGVTAERARQIYVKAIRQTNSSAAAHSMMSADAHLRSSGSSRLNLPECLLHDLACEGFHDLSPLVLRRVHLALPRETANAPQSVMEFADLMIAGAAKATRGPQPFGGQAAIDVLAWAEPRSSGRVTISAERRAQLTKRLPP